MALIEAAATRVPMAVQILISPWAAARTATGASSMAMERSAPPTTMPMPRPAGTLATRNSHRPTPVMADRP